MLKEYNYMKTIQTILLFLLFNCSAYSQNCKTPNISSYDDTLNVILNYEYYLFCNPKLALIKKLTTPYVDYSFNQHADTCFLFLIPDSKDEFASDGDFVSQCIHKSTLEKQKNVKWIEVIYLVKVRNFYLFTITTNKMIEGKKVIQKKIHYKVSCTDKSANYQYRRKLLLRNKSK
jgi:hypothetical protein